MLAMYVGLAYITVATEHFYVYTFLNDHNSGGRGRVAGYIFGILALAIVVFVVVHCLILLRRWIVETKKGNMGKLQWRGDQAPRAEGVMMESKA